MLQRAQAKAQAEHLENIRFVQAAYDSLEPGGLLSVTQVIADPDSQSKQEVPMKHLPFSTKLFLLSGLAAILLFVSAQALYVGAAPPTPEQQVQAAWRRAQQSGVYHYTTEILQTTYPAPMLANVGRSAREDRLYIEGQTNLPAREMLMTLWQSGGNVATGKEGVEVRLKGDQAYGRTLGAEWQEIDNFSSVFAPGGDVLAYLAGAKNVKREDVKRENDPAPFTFYASRFTFDLDGPAFGSYVRDQLERYLLEKGELPAGLTLEVSNEYLHMSGAGEIWLTQDGLPARLIINAQFPQQENGERVAVAIKTDFSGFAPMQRADLPGFESLAGLLGLRTPRDWQRVSAQLGLFASVLALCALLVTVRGSRLLYTAIALSIIFAMVVSPLLQSQQAYAFSERQAAKRAEQAANQEENEAQRNLIESLYTSNWDPHRPADRQLAANSQSLLPNPLSSLSTLSTSAANSANPGVDTDKDGLTDAQEAVLGTNPQKADSDGDTLTDGQEALFLGTNPRKADSDDDLITDNVEVAGFMYAGKRWYTNPNSPDSNRDGLPDSVECPELIPPAPGQLSPLNTACRDTDGDGTPDVFDFDDDNDGVSDRTDLSPQTKIEGLSGSHPFNLTVNNLEANRDVLVDFQLRPLTATHLTYAMNVLDWPTGDAEGQVIRQEDTTFADLLPAGQRGADPSQQNGDMRLTPMLEIVMSGAALPLPRATPHVSLQLNQAAAGWISVTVNLAQVGANTVFTPTHTGGPVDAQIYAGRCLSATDSFSGATAIYTFVNIASGTPTTILTKTLALMNGGHALVLQRASQTACLNLIDLPNGQDPDQMIDTNALGSYNIAVRDANAEGSAVAAYVPLNMVNDPVGEQRQAFGARMFYRQSGAVWGNAHEIRLVWLVQLLNDAGQIQTIHIYQDEFTLTGLSVREDHGLNVAVAFEDPAVDQDVTADDSLWMVAEGLRAAFTSGRDADNNNQRDLPLSEFVARFNNRSNADDATIKRWGIPAGRIKTLTFAFANQDYLGLFPTGKNAEILNAYFMDGSAPRADAPTLLFAREEKYRVLNLQATQSVNLQANQATLDLAQDTCPEQTLAAFNWAPFRYQNGVWQAYPLSQYWDVAGARYLQIFKAHPPAFLSQTDPEYERSLKTLTLIAKSNYLALMQGEVGVVANGALVLEKEKAEEEEDDELAETIWNDTVGAVMGTVAGIIAEDLCKSFVTDATLAAQLKTSIQGLSGEDAIKKISAQFDQFTGESFTGKGGIEIKGVGKSIWDLANIGLAGVSLILTIVAAWSGSQIVAIIAAGVAAAAAVLGVIDAAVKLYNAHKTAVQLATTMANVSQTVGAAASKAGIVGLVISTVVSLGLFITQWAMGGWSLGSLAFNAALAGMIAGIITAVIMLAIAAIPVVGQIIAAIIGAIDAVINLICKAVGWEESSVQQGEWHICRGISGTITWVVQNFIYTTTNLVESMNDPNAPPRLLFPVFKPALVDAAQGYVLGAAVEYNITVRNPITLTNPLRVPRRDYPNWMSLAYGWQFNESNLRNAAFAYTLQDNEDKFSVEYNSMRQEWKPGISDRQWYIERTLVASIELDATGINQPARLYLNEAYAVPTQECWSFPLVTLLIPVCTVRADAKMLSETSHIDLGKMVKWDVFPATLDGFYTPAAKDGGYALAWGQSAVGTITSTGKIPLTFQRLKDFDGDGLLNKADGGLDPNDTTWDADGDGLSDPYEIAHGSNPQVADSDADGLNDYEETRLGADPTRADSDGDGLTDYEEMLGWEFVYGFDAAGAPLKTWVYSDPLRADADNDTLNDAQEKAWGAHPNVVTTGAALTYRSQLTELNAARLLLRFEETVNATAFGDSSGLAHAATCAGAACPTSGVSGRYGNALNFDGVDDYVQVASSDALNPARLSVAAWVKAAAWTPQPDYGVIVGKDSDVGGNKGYVLRTGDNGRLSFSVSVNGVWCEALTSQVMSTGTWYHVAGTFDGSAARVYLNGNLQASQPCPGALAHTTGPLNIGRDPTWTDRRFTGAIDEVAIVGSSLADTQIQTVMEARYNLSDMVVSPADPLWYEGRVKNELLNRYAQGLLRIQAPSTVVNQVPPTTFVIQPNQSQTLAGGLTIQASAPADPISVTQVAGGQVVDWREASDYAELWLKLDEPAGATTLMDSSGVQPPRNGSCSGAACPTLDGNAARFDGVNDYISVPNNAGLNPASLTAAAWINAQGWAAESWRGVIVGKDTDVGGNKGYALRAGANGRLSFVVSANGAWCEALTPQVMSAGTWYHVAGTYDGATARAYINGVERASNNCSGPLLHSTGELDLGRDPRWTDRLFAGSMDEARIYGRALTAQEIGALYARPVLRLEFEGVGPSGAPGLTDSSNSGNSVTCSTNCPAATSGVAGRALQLNGSQYVAATGNALDLSSGRFTQSAWVWPEADIEAVAANGCPAETPLKAEYYNTQDLSGAPVYTQCEAFPALGLGADWGYGSPSGLNPNNFSVRWTGRFNILTAGTHDFLMGGDDGFRAYWDDALFIGDWNESGYRQKTATRALTAGEHTLKVEYFESTDQARLYFSWQQWQLGQYPRGILGANSGESNGYPTLQQVGKKLRVGFGNGVAWTEYTTPDDVLTLNTWNHVAAAFDGTTYRIYVNGVERANTTAFSGRQPAPANQTWIGRSSNRATLYLRGVHTYNEGDDSGDAELCMAMKNSPTAAQKGIWSQDVGGDSDYDIDQSRPFTETAYLRIWEDDGGVKCGDNEDDGDDFVWDKTFSTNDLGLPNPTHYYWTGTDDTQGYLVLGSLTSDPEPRYLGLANNAMPFRGRIDNAQIYRYSLSQEAINALYQAGTLAMYLPLDDPAGAGLMQQGFRNAVDPTNASNGRCAGAATCPTTGIVGRANLAASFDGVDDYIQVPNSDALNPAQLTVAAWVKADAWSPEVYQGVIVGKDTDAGGIQGYALRVGANGRLSFVVGIQQFPFGLQRSWCEASTPSSVMNVGTWYHVAGVYDGLTARVYVNGVEQAVGDCGLGWLSPSTVDLNIGRSPGWTDRRFNGAIDDVRIYRRPLAAQEIQGLYRTAPASLFHLEETVTQNGFADAGGAANGTCAGAACPVAGVKGQVGLAAKFDGINDYVQASNSAALNPERLTVAAWINADFWTPEIWRGVIVGKDSDAAGNRGYALRAGNNGQLSFVVAVNGQWCEAVVTSTLMSTGNWYHVAGVYDGSAARVYINGVPQASRSCPGALAHTTDALNIGRSPRWTDRLFRGAIDEVSVYAAALSDFDVRDLYRSQLRYVEDRQSDTVWVDTAPPSSILMSYYTAGPDYRPNRYQVLGVTASDRDSDVALVELGACRGAGCQPAWTAAAGCSDAAGGAAWCPGFDPTTLGGEGRYTLQTRATDKVGYRETPTRTYTLYVDGTPPVVTSNIAGGALLPATPDAVSARWTVTLAGTVNDPPLAGGDPGSGVANMAVTLYTAADQPAGDGTQSPVIQGDQWTLAYAFVEPPTGLYTLTLVAQDKVGNTAAPVNLRLRLDAAAPQVRLDLSGVPTATISGTVTLPGVATEVPTTTGDFMGVQSAAAAFIPLHPALYNEQPAGEILRLPLDDQPNTQGLLRFADISGNGRDGVCSGAACPTTGAPGRIGDAARFDGNDQVTVAMRVADAPQFTLAAWAALDTLDEWDNLIQFGGSYCVLLYSYVSDVYSRTLVLTIPTTDGRKYLKASNVLARADAFYHIVGAYDGNTMRLYVNGQQVGSQIAPGLHYPGCNNQVVLGRWMRGALDEVRIFNRALSSAEVQALYLDTGGQPTLRLPFDERRAVGGDTFAAGDLIATLNAGAGDTANKAVAGQVGAFALRFDGVDDTVSVPNSAALNPANLTVAAWIRADSWTAEAWRGAIVGKDTDAGGNKGYALRAGDNGRLSFNISVNGTWCEALTPQVMSAGTWYHVAGSYDGSAARVYINGNLRASQPCPGALAHTTDPLNVGRDPRWTDRLFAGLVDDVRLYPRALSAAEVKELTAMGWQAAALSASGTGVASATFNVSLPAGLEGDYRLALRAADAGGNVNFQNGNAWNGAIDTLAPRAALVRTYPTANTTRYELTAQDFNLNENGIQFLPCAMQVVERQNYGAAWYLAGIGTARSKLYWLRVVCEVNERQTNPVSATVCDQPGNCATVNLGAGQRVFATDLLGLGDPTGLAASPLSVAIVTPTEGSVFTTTAEPITLTGALESPDYVRALTVTVDAIPTLLLSWPVTAAMTSTTWAVAWAPVTEGRHTIVAAASDYATHTVNVTSTFFVDTDVPTLTLTSTPYNIWYDANGGIEIRGLVTDTGGIASVMMDVSGPVSMSDIEAVVNGNSWTASWPVGFDAPIDGAPYTFTVRATDVAGRQATITEPDFVVDMISPQVSIASVQFDGVTATVGQTVTAAAVTATFAFSATDKNGIGRLWYAWTPDPLDPGYDYPGLITITNPGPDLITVTMPLTVSPATAGVARYLYVGASDTWTGYSSVFWGPFYQDPPGAPDYVGMDEPRGPFAGQPYREWMDNGCTLLGTDRRIADRVQAGGALDRAQNLYVSWSGPTQRLTASGDGWGVVTWEEPKLRLSWTGANWDSDGDLFIYLDTLPDLPVYPGGNVAYNPYAATMSDTIVLLPTSDTPCDPDTPPDEVFAADYAVWVQDSRTATLLQWDTLQNTWVPTLTLPLVGSQPLGNEDWGYHFEPGGPGYTDLSLPFAMLGITDPTTGTLGLVAFASEENALRLWAVMPPANPVNSQRVARLAPAANEPSRLVFSDQYTLQLGDGVCHQRAGRLQLEMSANPGGLSYSLTDDETRLLFGPTCEAHFAPYDDAYAAWLQNEFCPLYPWRRECRADRDLTQVDILAALSGFRQVEFPPVQPNQALSYTIHYVNETPLDYQDVWAIMSDWYDSVIWPNDCYLVPLGDIRANSRGAFTLAATAGQNGAGDVTAVLLKRSDLIGLDPDHCTYDYPAGMITVLAIDHTEDQEAPRYVALQSPRTVIGPERVVLRGVVADASPVPTITVQAQGPRGSATFACLDDTPGDGQWNCDWDVPASNGGIRPDDGDVFQLQFSATDPFGQTSAWTAPLTLTVDTVPPTLTLAARLQATAPLPLLSGARPVLDGALSDNRLANRVEVCDAAGQGCAPAGTPDATWGLTTTYTYDDEPAASIPIADAVQNEVCGASVVRTFAVSEAFAVADVQVGLNLTHAFRGDLVAILQAPSGVTVTLVQDSDNNRHNYDVLLTDAASKAVSDDWQDHDTAAPYYEHRLYPSQPLWTFHGEQAQGVWTLTLCDRWLEDTGAYQRSRLILSRDVLPANTQANWSYALPNVEDSDNQVYTSTLYALDSVGNRTLTQMLVYRVDNVAPVLTVTQAASTVWLNGQDLALAGLVRDGDQAHVLALVQDPQGVQTQENVPLNDGEWQFHLHPVWPGDHTVYIHAIDPAGNLTTAGPYRVRVIAAPRLVKQIEPMGEIPLGSVVTYTLKLYNDNAEPIPSIVITDPLPVLLSNPRTVTGTVFLPVDNTLRWGPFALNGNDTATLIFTAIVTNASAYYGATVSNMAYLTAAGFDPGVSNVAEFRIEQAPPAPYLVITKSVATAHTPAQLGDSITYTIVVTNSGFADAVGVMLTDTLPAGVTGAGLNWTGVISATQSVSFTLGATVTTDTAYLGRPITNTVYLSHASGNTFAHARFAIASKTIIYLPVVMQNYAPLLDVSDLAPSDKLVIAPR